MKESDIWVIGDLQGCYSPLVKLMSNPVIAGNPNSMFWYAGDLVNRGPESLAALRYVINLGSRAVTVLGNHDLHLLAVIAGARHLSRSDTLEEVLSAPDIKELVDWLRYQPLAHFENNHLLVHAGILPGWDIAKVLALANEVEQILRAPEWQKNVRKLYDNTNSAISWNENLKRNKRLQVITNAFTRLRMCTSSGEMDFKLKSSPRDSICSRLLPWFDTINRTDFGHTIVFGHWSSLSFMIKNNCICLDTGCVWGGFLTAMRLSDRKVIQVRCCNPENLQGL